MQPIVDVNVSPAGLRLHAGVVPAGAVGVSPTGWCPLSAPFSSAAIALRHRQRRDRERTAYEAASPGPGGASCLLCCSRAPRWGLRQWDTAFDDSVRRVGGRSVGKALPLVPTGDGLGLAPVGR